MLQCILEKVSYNKNIQVEGVYPEEIKQASEDSRKECYSQICFVGSFTFVKVLWVAYVTICHRSFKIMT